MRGETELYILVSLPIEGNHLLISVTRKQNSRVSRLEIFGTVSLEDVTSLSYRPNFPRC